MFEKGRDFEVRCDASARGAAGISDAMLVEAPVGQTDDDVAGIRRMANERRHGRAIRLYDGVDAADIRLGEKHSGVKPQLAGHDFSQFLLCVNPIRSHMAAEFTYVLEPGSRSWGYFLPYPSQSHMSQAFFYFFRTIREFSPG